MKETARLPYAPILFASRFVSTDKAREALMHVCVKAVGKQISVYGTDGLRAFRIKFNQDEDFFMPDGTILLSPGILKKEKKADRLVLYENRHVVFCSDLKQLFLHYSWNSVINEAELEYPDVDFVWPDKFHNSPEKPISFDARLLADFVKDIHRFSDSAMTGIIKLNTNGVTNPMVFSCDFSVSNTIQATAEFMLMPVRTRN